MRMIHSGLAIADKSHIPHSQAARKISTRREWEYHSHHIRPENRFQRLHDGATTNGLLSAIVTTSVSHRYEPHQWIL